MKDRIAVNPGRVLITPESGTPYYATLTRADNPTQEGTPLNKANLLSDATAAKYGLGAAAVPNDMWNAIGGLPIPVAKGGTGVTNLAALATALGGPKIQIGSYVGAGTYGASNQNTLTFSFAPKLVIIASVSTTTSKISAVPLVALAGSEGSYFTSGSNSSMNYFTWSGNSFSWYNGSSAISQHNVSGYSYRYIAIG